MAILGGSRGRAAGIYQLPPPLLRQNPVDITTTQTSRKAPIRGWNTKDSLADMDIGYAVRLDNWVPREESCEMRPGYAAHATGVGTAVESLLPFRDATQDKLLAASGTQIYDVTLAGAASSLATGLTNGRWQHVNFNNHLIMVNGDDAARKYNGTLATTSFTGTGLTPADLINVAVYKNRLWFCEKGSMSAWYAATEAIAGTLTEFRLDYVTSEGGYLEAIGAWSIEGGNGPEQLIVFYTSEGEVVIYSGDPASTFAIVGVYKIGKPIGRRCMLQLGADLVLLSEDGYINVRAILEAREAYVERSISDKIRPSVRKDVLSHGDKFGWQAVQWATQNLVVINVPIAELSRGEQHVLNTLTGAWCRFTNLNAVSWAGLGRDLYFGTGAGEVQRMANDERSDAGSAITALGRPAYDYLNARGRVKNPTLQRHQVQADGDFTIVVSLDVDFRENGSETTVEVSLQSGDAWDVAPWDTTPWGDTSVANDWIGAGGSGYAFSPRLEVTSNNVRPKWIAYDLVWANGGVV